MMSESNSLIIDNENLRISSGTMDTHEESLIGQDQNLYTSNYQRIPHP